MDPEWIESLNSVLDDNKLLTLPSGERIQFGPNVNFMFECHSLRFASPATGERSGQGFRGDHGPQGACNASSGRASLLLSRELAKGRSSSVSHSSLLCLPTAVV